MRAVGGGGFTDCYTAVHTVGFVPQPCFFFWLRLGYKTVNMFGCSVCICHFQKSLHVSFIQDYQLRAVNSLSLQTNDRSSSPETPDFNGT
jgi:hypothetical protein